nr:uncharacterized protein LOC109735542 isoform X2 [Aegilops tauschii subsp. strangulata]
MATSSPAALVPALPASDLHYRPYLISSTCVRHPTHLPYPVSTASTAVLPSPTPAATSHLPRLKPSTALQESPSMRCRRLVLPTADLGSLRSQIQQAAASSSDVTAAVSSSPFSPRPWWNSMRIKKLSRSLGTLHLVVSSASSLPYSFSIVMEKPQDPSEEKKG